jgi:hypothetical protein
MKRPRSPPYPLAALYLDDERPRREGIKSIRAAQQQPIASRQAVEVSLSRLRKLQEHLGFYRIQARCLFYALQFMHLKVRCTKTCYGRPIFIADCDEQPHSRCSRFSSGEGACGDVKASPRLNSCFLSREGMVRKVCATFPARHPGSTRERMPPACVALSIVGSSTRRSRNGA